MDKKLSSRFIKLLAEADDIDASKTCREDAFNSGWSIKSDDLLGWKVKVKHLLSLACGQESQHFTEFLKQESSKGMGDSSYLILKRLRVILAAAQDDFEGGYMLSLRTLVQAEVFDNELDQARELLNSRYKAAAAVACGVVLETAIRELCARNGITAGAKDKLDTLNASLTKAGVYNTIQQKRVTYLSGIRNSAAHGDAVAYTEDDVTAMISEVEMFLSAQLV